MSVAAKIRVLAAALFVLTACAGDDLEESPSDENAPPVSTVPYSVSIEGDLPSDVSSFLLAASRAAQSTDRPPTSEMILRRRVEEDIPRLETALRAQGYFAGAVTYRIDVRAEEEETESTEAESDGESSEDIVDILDGPAHRVVFEIDPGERFVFGSRSVTVLGDSKNYLPPKIGSIGLKQDEPAIAQRVFDAEARLVQDAKEHGYPFAKAGGRSIMVDYDTMTMDVEISIETGEKTPFAEPALDGYEGIDRDFVRGRIPFEAGDTFDARKVEQARLSLLETNLFNNVEIVEGSKTNKDGELPVRISLSQRKHRTIGAGIGYRTDDGPGGRIFWQHRNFLGGGEDLRVALNASQSLQQLNARIRRRDFVWSGIDLIGDANVKNEETDAFDSRSTGLGLGLTKELSRSQRDLVTGWNRNIRGSIGVAYRYAQIEEPGEEEDTVGLLSFPAALEFDFSDSLLDPSQGWRLALTSAPFWDTLGLGTRFLKSRATGTAYYRIQNNPRLVVALRGSIGSIVGASREEVPADERFYAGGGGSVRGVPFQLAGPLDDGEPIGGRSVLEGSLELRWRRFDPIELVAFYDAGTVFESSYPDLDGDLEMGTGIGVRYNTAVGPLRFDFAIPVDKRDGIDDSFQFYISIGQAF